MQSHRTRAVLVLWQVLLLQFCRAEYSANDCLVGDLKTEDCRFGTLVIDTDGNLNVNEAVRGFKMTLKQNWTDVTQTVVQTQQIVDATIRNGTMRYFYTKMTDRPLDKIVDNAAVFIRMGSGRQRALKSCDLAADLSDADSLKWEDCYMILVSQHYASMKVYVPKDQVGADLDCASCVSDTVYIHMSYTVTSAVCSRRINKSGNETVEGRSYVYYMRDWDIFPNPMTLEFAWPANYIPSACQLDGVELPMALPAGGSHGSAVAVVRGESSIQSLDYFSWQPSEYIGTCYYGPIPAGKVADVFLSLFILSLIICCVMVLLLAWSKYASWQWYGGDFEWDVKSVDEESDGGCAEDEAVSRKVDGKKASWVDRRPSLSTLSLTNWMYGKGGDEQLNYSASGSMEIGSSTVRRRKSSIDLTYSQAESITPSFQNPIMNPMLAHAEEQHKERVDSFKPSAASRQAPEHSFDWSQFGNGSTGGHKYDSLKDGGIEMGAIGGDANEDNAMNPMLAGNCADDV